MTKSAETALVGLCTGLFAAAAIASSQSLSSLIPIAVQVSLMAFRVGAHVTAVAERIHRDTDSSDTWAYVLPNVVDDEIRSIIDSFHKDAVGESSLSLDLG